MNELPPFWNLMSPEEQYMYSVNPNMRGPLTQLYLEGNMKAIPQGGILDGEMQPPQQLGSDMQYAFPRDQGLLDYGTQRGDGLSPERGYHGSLDYPEHAPNTPEHKQAYNFLRFNNFGGGI